MGFLSAMGLLIIIISIIGLAVGFIEALMLQSLLTAGMVLLGSAVGFYLGYLGIKVDELEQKSKRAH
ncbi:MAG: hypothetical protein ABSB53_04570 [Nitrososphaerales archaeon]|jgi:hypothetical protein